MKCSLVKVIVAAIMVAVLAGVIVGITLLVVKSSGKTVSFPETFKFGAASASYQIEGGWDADGKSPNIWDHTMHQMPNYTADSKNGDVAADSYNMWQKDLDALDDIKFEVYRFSLSWTRILPDGTRVNQKGIDYYNKIIDGLIAQGMEPLVTIFHWDLPQYIQDLGGWTNPQIADYFREFADVVYYHFGDRVKRWITVNEPSVFCGEGYGYTTKAPAISSPGVGDYLCAYNVLLANAAAYHLYQEKYFNQQRGQVGICVNAGMSWPWDPENPKDVKAAERSIQFDMGKFTHPIFSKTGGYPPVMVDLINKKSKNEGRPWSRLPVMTYGMQKYIHGTADFLAVNYYSSGYAADREENPDFAPSWWADMNTEGHGDPTWVRAKSEWLYKVPEGLHDLLVWIKNNYDNPSVMITENGWSDDGELKDDGRILYIREHLEALARAVEEGCDVNAYTVWSLTDNFEWKMGYTERFGIHYIDFDSVDKTRVPKDSAKFFKQFMADGKKFEF